MQLLVYMFFEKTIENVIFVVKFFIMKKGGFIYG